MRVQAAAPDEVATRLGKLEGSQTSQHRSRQQHGTPDPARQLPIGFGLGIHVRRAQSEGARSGPIGANPEAPHDLEKGLHILDLGDVLEPHLLSGEEGARQNRKRGVLVAGWPEHAAQLVPALNAKVGHGPRIVPGFPALTAFDGTLTGPVLATGGKLVGTGGRANDVEPPAGCGPDLYSNPRCITAADRPLGWVGKVWRHATKERR